MRQERHEFSRKVKRAAYKRADGRCEARGTIYGLQPETRCTAFLGPANVEYDHWPVPATDDGSDTLENCVACCKECHRIKTSTYDQPMQAKGRRIRRENGPVDDRRKPKKPLRGRPFQEGHRAIASRPFQQRTKS